ncbi:heme o synthase [Gorillibacterium massiliense]|uniref:heme o synthase n=1 Tax=Gorillibacterium massiliense TaxID=1280390 RepID=UPI0004AF76A1|nr:heme o synthase [Gorillibacterium massiliense]
MKKELSLNEAVELVDSPDLSASMERVTIKDFINMTKPGILFSNLITTFGGFWIAANAGGSTNWLMLLYTLVGTALVMAAGCVLNNYLDRDLDLLMARTKGRALPTGKVSPQTVLWYGISLGIAGMIVLALISPLASFLGLIGMVVYVGIYTAWLKRTSVWCTVFGAISGAVPPVIGYVGGDVNHSMGLGALVLFGILFLWQPPHFWALGIRRAEDYRAAGFPMLPVVKGNHTTKISMMRYVVPLVPVSMLLYPLGLTSMFYMISAAILGLIWVYLVVKGFKAKDEIQWAKQVFLYSVNYLTILFFILIIDASFFV